MMQYLLDGKSRLLVVVAVAVALLAALLLSVQPGRAKPPMKIGVLHSLSGTMAASEAPLVDALRLCGGVFNLALIEQTKKSGISRANSGFGGI